MGFTWTVPLNDTWIDHDYYLHVNTNTVVIEQGSRQRGLPCIVCAVPIGSQPAHLLCLVAGILCPNDHSHLNAAGLFCHAQCMPRRQQTLIRAVVAALQTHHD